MRQADAIRLDDLLPAPLLICFFSTFAIWAFQILTFLKTGVWRSVSVIDGVLYFLDSPWLHFPTNWLGLHQVLDWLNAGAALVVLAFPLTLLFAWVVGLANK